MVGQSPKSKKCGRDRATSFTTAWVPMEDGPMIWPCHRISGLPLHLDDNKEAASLGDYLHSIHVPGNRNSRSDLVLADEIRQEHGTYLEGRKLIGMTFFIPGLRTWNQMEWNEPNDEGDLRQPNQLCFLGEGMIPKISQDQKYDLASSSSPAGKPFTIWTS